MAISTYFIAGLLFAVGLVVAGMTQPAKVVHFLDFSGDWDPSLAFVMGGAISVHAVSYHFIMKRKSPVFSGQFLVPTRQDIDVPLVAGAALFGIGWGLGGYCPGPALTSLGAASGDAALFTGALLAGHWAFAGYSRVKARIEQRNAKRQGEEASAA